MTEDQSGDEGGFDPEGRKEAEIGRGMVDGSEGLGTVAAHLYRGEVERAVSWRGRLDATTNWAVTIIAGILAYAFSSEEVAHSIILAGIVIGLVFLLIEAGRFRRYDIWRSRVRALQENLFATALDPSAGVEHRDWRRQLSEDYRDPDPKMSRLNALAHRLRRVYLPLLSGLLFVWLFRLNGEDEPLIAAASVSDTPGWIIFWSVIAAYVALYGLALLSRTASRTETGGSVDRGDLEREDD